MNKIKEDTAHGVHVSVYRSETNVVRFSFCFSVCLFIVMLLNTGCISSGSSTEGPQRLKAVNWLELSREFAIDHLSLVLYT